MIWPFNRKPSAPSVTWSPEMQRAIDRFIAQNEEADRREGFTNTVCFKKDGEWTAYHRTPERDDLHATIVQTLQRHGHLPVYELADEIVAAVVEGSRS